ncbi:unnamed protein product [Linum trigynum]|uniref:Uncharacterized protein n=1 Tax=Linum trigynum TaxID=586398 RepID=A0AAV2E4Z8_9ROSI
MTLENEPEQDVSAEKISFLKKLFKNLLSCSREIRRDVIAYPPAPASPRPSSHTIEVESLPPSPPRRSKRRQEPVTVPVQVQEDVALPDPYEYGFPPVIRELGEGSSGPLLKEEEEPTMLHRMVINSKSPSKASRLR